MKLLKKQWFVILLLSLVAIIVIGMTIDTRSDEAHSETINETIETPEVTPETPPIPDLGYLRNEPARYIAKTVWGEARGCSTTEQAAVIWCILNRVDTEDRYYPDDIISVITQKNQFHGYSSKHPVTDDIYNLTIDVLTRWMREKNGEVNVGRVLPKEYLWFSAKNNVNYFRDAYSGGNTWDWRFESPYGNN
jgi:hypothetical protein